MTPDAAPVTVTEPGPELFRMTFYYVAAEDDDGVTETPRVTPTAVASGTDNAPTPSREPGSEPGSEPDSETGDPEVPAATPTAEVEPSVAAAPSVDPSAEPVHSPEAVLASAVPGNRVTLFGPSCEPITEVTRSFAMDAQMQGTGRLRDGRVINIWGSCDCPRSPCFKVTGRRWGTGGNGRALQPFRTVAVDPAVVPLGTLLYVPHLDGKRMPGKRPWGGFVHDGCLVADDTGGAIRGHQLDLFVGQRSSYRAMGRLGASSAWSKQVSVLPGAGRCERRGERVLRANGST